MLIPKSWVAASYCAARGRFPSFRWVLYVIIRNITRKGRFPRFWVAEDESFDRIPRRMSREILARVFFEIRFRPDAFVPDAFVPDAVVPDAFAAERPEGQPTARNPPP